MLMSIAWPNELTADDFKEIRLVEDARELKAVVGENEAYRFVSHSKDGIKLFRWLAEEYPQWVSLDDEAEEPEPEPLRPIEEPPAGKPHTPITMTVLVNLFRRLRR